MNVDSLGHCLFHAMTFPRCTSVVNYGRFKTKNVM